MDLRILLLLAVTVVVAHGQRSTYVPYDAERPAGEREYSIVAKVRMLIKNYVAYNRKAETITRIGVISYRMRDIEGGFRQYLFKLQINNGIQRQDIWGARVRVRGSEEPVFEALFGPIDGYLGPLNDPDLPALRRPA